VAFSFVPDTVFANDACGIIEGSTACTRLNNRAKIQAMQPRMVPMPREVQDEIEHTMRLAQDGYEHTIELTRKVG
jgi:hypothetical protein